MADAKSAYYQVIARAGNKKRLAESLGISRQAVDRWRVVPERWCARVQVLYGWTPPELRPDLFLPGHLSAINPGDQNGPKS
ncbi:MAG: helix-turn-helix domain-containing protein [Patescibacteria group bacterium]|nr:helix-turn-helix domain-containing protein [Patescibacteria group bacterium]